MSEEEREILEGPRWENQEPEPEEQLELETENSTVAEDSTPDEPEAEVTSAEEPTLEGETVEQDVVDGAVEEPVTETEVELNAYGKPFYSDEEVLSLIQKGEDGKYQQDFDSSRIKPGTVAEAMYKRMQAQFTPQLQQRSELQKQLEAMQGQLKQVQETQAKSDPQKPQTWQDAFDENPVNTMSYLDQLIAKARLDDPYGEDTLNLLNLKDDLTSQMFQKQHEAMEAQRTVQTQQNFIAKAHAEVERAVPGYFEKVDEYNSFATELGFTPNHIGALTDSIFWARVGLPDMPVILAKAISNMHSIAKNPQQVVKKKAVKVPTAVEAPGTGSEEAKTEEWGGQSAIEEMGRMRITS